jgi:hypothetical protein
MDWLGKLIPGYKSYLGATITFLAAVMAFLQYLNGAGEGSFLDLWKAVMAAGIALMGAGQRSALKQVDQKVDTAVAVMQMRAPQQ